MPSLTRFIKQGEATTTLFTNIGFGSFFAVKIGKIKQPVHTHGWIFGGPW
jgi:hypothetical protein